MGKWNYRRTTVISLGLVSFIAGLGLARLVDISGWQAIILVAALTPLLSSKSRLNMLSIMFIALALGCYRGTIFSRLLVPYTDLSYKLVTIVATATTDAVYGQKSQLDFDVGNVRLAKPYPGKLVGTISLGGYGQSMIYRGDQVWATAKLYPGHGSRQARLSFAEIRLIKPGDSSIQRLRRRFVAGLQSALPEPLASLALGLLVGQRSTLPPDFNQLLIIVGLTHIVAVSGYNLTIIIQTIRRVAERLSKFQSTVLTLSLIGLFLVITGSSASITRAALVCMLSLWAWYFGRIIKPQLLILLAAALTAGWFPPYLWSDIGWWLSFLAFAGILIVAPILVSRFNVRNRAVKMIIETLVAQLMTLPLILFVFGRLSVIALAANLLVVPLVPIAMGLSLVAGLLAMVLPGISGWLAWPALISLTYMVDIIRLLARLPFASINLAINSWQLIVAYGCTTFTIFTWRHKKAKITDINISK